MYPIGSTGQLAEELYKYAGSHGYEPYLFYGIGEKSEDPQIIKIEGQFERAVHKGLSILFGNQGSYSSFATKRLIQVLKEKKIKKVILLNLHGYYINEGMLLEWLKENTISVVYVTCDEYAGLGKCPYSYDCTNYQHGCGNCPRLKEYPKSLFLDRTADIVKMKEKGYENPKIVFAGPQVNIDKFRQSYLLKDKKLSVLDWGVDLSQYKPSENKEILAKYGIPEDKIIILSVASYSDPRKGIKDYFIPASKMLNSNTYHFINVGFNGKVEEVSSQSNLTVIPYIKDQNELCELFSAADLMVIPSLYDTQPITALISFACGTPVCCFDTSGLSYIGPRDSDITVYAEDISVKSLAEAISKTKKKTAEISMKCRKYAEERYSILNFCERVLRGLNND